jgi:hypothetical protein
VKLIGQGYEVDIDETTPVSIEWEEGVTRVQWRSGPRFEIRATGGGE